MRPLFGSLPVPIESECLRDSPPGERNPATKPTADGTLPASSMPLAGSATMRHAADKITACNSSLRSCQRNPRPRVYALTHCRDVLNYGVALLRANRPAHQCGKIRIRCRWEPPRISQQSDSLRVQQRNIEAGSHANTYGVVVTERLIK